MADNSPEGHRRREASRRAMDAMSRVHGKQFHTRIVEALEAQKGITPEVIDERHGDMP